MESFRYLKGRKSFDIITCEKPIPTPAERQVLVRVLACGVCGTDIHILNNFPEYAPLGHEICAQVVHTGPAVSSVKAGDQVVVEDVTFCGTCENCKNGRMDICTNMYTLLDQSGMGEYLLVHESMLIPAAGLDPAVACLTEPLTVALNTYFAADLPPEGNLVIFGTGILGIFCAAIAKHYGAGTVTCVNSGSESPRNRKRTEAALLLGADAVIGTNDQYFKQKVIEIAGKRVDAVIVTSPPRTLPQALAIAGYGSPVVTIGVDMGPNSTVEIDIDRMIFNKNSIIPVLGEPEKRFPLSLKLLGNKVVAADKLITDTFAISSAQASLKEFYGPDHGVVKAILLNK